MVLGSPGTVILRFSPPKSEMPGNWGVAENAKSTPCGEEMTCGLGVLDQLLHLDVMLLGVDPSLSLTLVFRRVNLFVRWHGRDV